MAAPRRHLLLVISPHGYGHAAQASQVVNALRAHRSGLRLTVQTTLSSDYLHSRIDGEFDVISRASDFGLLMRSALEIDLDASAAAYAALHARWDEAVAEEAAALTALAPDLLLADVPYLSLAAAHVAGVPAIALCSLHWADIYRHYFSSRAEAAQVLAQMETAYQQARAFLRPEPAMPMPGLSNTLPIGPLARCGRNRHGEIIAALGLAEDARLVLVAPGGVAARFAVEQWPRVPGVYWIVQADWQVTHPDALSLDVIEALGLSFIDVLASSQAVLGKLGYGTVTECVCNGIPLLYVPRDDWPEEPVLADWLQAHGQGLALAQSALQGGDGLMAALQALWNQPAPAQPLSPAAARGDRQAAAFLDGMLDEVSAVAG